MPCRYLDDEELWHRELTLQTVHCASLVKIATSNPLPHSLIFCNSRSFFRSGSPSCKSRRFPSTAPPAPRLCWGPRPPVSTLQVRLRLRRY